MADQAAEPFKETIQEYILNKICFCLNIRVKLSQENFRKKTLAKDENK